MKAVVIITHHETTSRMSGKWRNYLVIEKNIEKVSNFPEYQRPGYVVT